MTPNGGKLKFCREHNASMWTSRRTSRPELHMTLLVFADAVIMHSVRRRSSAEAPHRDLTRTTERAPDETLLQRSVTDSRQ